VTLDARALTADRPGDDGPVRVLDSIDLTVPAGSLVDVIGASGSGKTTLLLALARLLPGASGTLILDGRAAERIGPQVWRTRVALLPQVPVVVVGTVADNLRLPWRLKMRAAETAPDDSALRRALDSLGLDEVDPERDAARLSVGQTARVALLRVLMTGPDVLLLDEPDASLDDTSAELVVGAVKRFVADGGAVVRVRHARTDAHAGARYRLDGGALTEVAG
jgi:putative ABC transport system ATP-binding protein